MSYRLLICCTVSLFAACNQIPAPKFVQDINISDVIDQGKQTGKISLIYLSNPDQKALDLDVLNYIENHFIFYEVNNDEKNTIRKLIHSDYSPLFIAIRGDSLVSIFNNPQDMAELLNKFKNITDNSLLQLELRSITELSADNKTIMNVLNRTIQLKYRKDKKDGDLLKYAKQMVNVLPYFYNTYLLSEISSIDSIEKNNIYESLWNSATQLERKIYTEELVDIYDNLSKRSAINKSRLKFHEMTCDFGSINKYDTVEYKYKFYNEGDNPVIISSVQSTCDCTIAEWPKYPIQPTKIDSITVRFIPRDVGISIKSIHIQTSEPANISLSLKANIFEN